MRCRVLLHERILLRDRKTLPGGVLLRGGHPGRQLLPLPRGYLLGVYEIDCEVSVSDLYDRQLLPGGLYVSDELLARNVPAVRGHDGRERMPGVRARVGVRVGRHVGDDDAVSYRSSFEVSRNPRFHFKCFTSRTAVVVQDFDVTISDVPSATQYRSAITTTVHRTEFFVSNTHRIARKKP